MKIIIIIPARLASKRLPNKPLHLIQGEPMILHVWQKAIKAGIGDVIVACDHVSVQKIIEQANGKAILTDPLLASGSDRIWAALQKIPKNETYEIIVNLQGDLPTISPHLIQNVLDPLTVDPNVDIATLGQIFKDSKRASNPHDVKIALSESPFPHMGRALYFSRSPIAYRPETFVHHIGVYAYRRKALEAFVKTPESYLEKAERLEQLRALELGLRIDVRLVDQNPISIDTPEDLKKLQKNQSTGISTLTNECHLL